MRGPISVAAVRTVVGAVALATALAGCSSGGSDGSGTPDPPRDGATAEASAEESAEDTTGVDRDSSDTYLALGDSYTAAPMVGSTTDVADGCFRSTENYPALVAKQLSLELIDVSCSGATTGDLLRPQVTMTGTTLPPQLDALSSDTDLVTISLGGNDAGLFANLVRGCGTERSPDPSAAPCTAADLAGGESSVRRTMQQTRQRLVAGIEAVHRRAPDAQVVVVGYPQIAPARGACAELPVAPRDAAFARQVNEQLTQQLEAAAAAADADYVDVFAATEGHDLCSDDPWIADGSVRPPDAAPYHPLAAEQRAVADLLVDLVGSG